MTVVFQYLPFFNAICSLVTTIQLESNHDNQKALFIDKSALLHNLFEGDSGKTSPNAAVSAQIRKYGGDNFSAAVRQYGFPYKVRHFPWPLVSSRLVNISTYHNDFG